MVFEPLTISDELNTIFLLKSGVVCPSPRRVSNLSVCKKREVLVCFDNGNGGWIRYFLLTTDE